MNVILKLRKINTEHQSPISYTLKSEDKEVDLNSLVGKKIKIEHTGKKFCIDTGKEIKKTFGQGYSWESFVTLPECDTCIVRPELCHYSSGTCRDPQWGEAHCLQPHVVYLSLTSGVKVGITRKKQVPFRWMDQGAVKAIKLCEVKNRLTSGKVEVEIAKKMADKTNWRNMLKNVYEDVDLLEIKKKIVEENSQLFEKNGATILDDELYTFDYPVKEYPQKISSLNFDKNPIIEGELIGIKGQYLIFDCGVINIRKYQGYEVHIQA